MPSSLRDRMISHAMHNRTNGNWKRILYMLLYGATARTIHRWSKEHH